MKIHRVLYVIIALLVMTGCKKDKTKPLDITGSWELMDIKTKAAQLGDQTIEVLITFNADNTYNLSQKIGSGRYRDFSGTWTLSGTTLDGDYSDGKKWGASYDVSIDGSQMTLTPQIDGAESYLYVKK